VSYIQAPFLPSCGQDSRGWTSHSIALLCLRDRVRHCRTAVAVRSVRTTCSSENIHIYRPDVALCRSELNSATVSTTPVRWKCSENKKYFLLVVTQARWAHLMDIAYRLKTAVFWEITPCWFVFCYGRFGVLDAFIFTQSESRTQVAKFTDTSKCFWRKILETVKTSCRIFFYAAYQIYDVSFVLGCS